MQPRFGLTKVESLVATLNYYICLASRSKLFLKVAMPEQELRLLALDGGGVRGLSSLQILKQLMDVIDPESPPKPCDYFDVIGGTSTGGFVGSAVR